VIEAAAREVWRLPSGLRFLDATSDIVASGGAVSLLLDDWADRATFLDELRWHLSSRGLTFQALHDHDPMSTSPIDCLIEGLGLSAVKSRYDAAGDAMLRLVGHEDLPDVTAVIAADAGGLGAPAWVEFAHAWAKSSKSMSDGGGTPPALCVVLTPAAAKEHDLPTDAQLAAHWMMGVPDALEMRLLCRLADDDEVVGIRRWREHIIPALCGSDLGLLPQLWNVVLEGHSALLDALNAYASFRGWTSEQLREAGVDTQMRIKSAGHAIESAEMAPPPRLRQAWSTGALMSTPEQGTEVNSAALPLLDAEDVLLQRLWRGQVGLVMPGIDGLRMAMCSQLTRRFGPRWATEFGLPPIEDEAQAVKKSPLACQWGHLLYLLRNHRRLHDFSEWIPLVVQARKVRNHLAHGAPITFYEYGGLRKAAEACGFGQWL